MTATTAHFQVTIYNVPGGWLSAASPGERQRAWTLLRETGTRGATLSSPIRLQIRSGRTCDHIVLTSLTNPIADQEAVVAPAHATTFSSPKLAKTMWSQVRPLETGIFHLTKNVTRERTRRPKESDIRERESKSCIHPPSV